MKPEEKWDLYDDLGGLCELCGLHMPKTDMDCHAHHCIVFKNQVKRAQQNTDIAKIDERTNVMLLHPRCHDLLQSDRQWTMDHKVAKHGQDDVDDFRRRMLPRTHGL